MADVHKILATFNDLKAAFPTTLNAIGNGALVGILFGLESLLETTTPCPCDQRLNQGHVFIVFLIPALILPMVRLMALPDSRKLLKGWCCKPQEMGSPMTDSTNDKSPETVSPKPGAPNDKSPEAVSPKPDSTNDKSPETVSPKPSAPNDKSPKTVSLMTDSTNDKSPETVSPKPGAPNDKSPETVSLMTDSTNDKSPETVSLMTDSTNDNSLQMRSIVTDSTNDKSPETVSTKPSAPNDKSPEANSTKPSSPNPQSQKAKKCRCWCTTKQYHFTAIPLLKTVMPSIVWIIILLLDGDHVACFCRGSASGAGNNQSCVEMCSNHPRPQLRKTCINSWIAGAVLLLFSTVILLLVHILPICKRGNYTWKGYYEDKYKRKLQKAKEIKMKENIAQLADEEAGIWWRLVGGEHEFTGDTSRPSYVQPGDGTRDVYYKDRYNRELEKALAIKMTEKIKEKIANCVDKKADNVMNQLNLSNDEPPPGPGELSSNGPPPGPGELSSNGPPPGPGELSSNNGPPPGPGELSSNGPPPGPGELSSNGPPPGPGELSSNDGPPPGPGSSNAGQ